MSDYSAHNGEQGHLLEIDRRGCVLQITLSNRLGEIQTAEFSEAETEEISAAIRRIYRNVRTAMGTIGIASN